MIRRRLLPTLAVALALVPPMLSVRPATNKERAVVVAIQRETSYVPESTDLCVTLGNHLSARAILSELELLHIKVTLGPCNRAVPYARDEIAVQGIKEPIAGTYDIQIELSEIRAHEEHGGIPTRQGTYEVRVKAGSAPEIVVYRPSGALERDASLQ